MICCPHAELTDPIFSSTVYWRWNDYTSLRMLDTQLACYCRMLLGSRCSLVTNFTPTTQQKERVATVSLSGDDD